MSSKERPPKVEVEIVEVKCPRCHETQIVRLPEEEIPKCPDCRVRMFINEVLEEGKSY